jgi:hypothetical protein
MKKYLFILLFIAVKANAFPSLALARVEHVRDIPVPGWEDSDCVTVYAIQRPYVALEFQYSDNLIDWSFMGYRGAWAGGQVVWFKWFSDVSARRERRFFRVIESESGLGWEWFSTTTSLIVMPRRMPDGIWCMIADNEPLP